MVYDLNGNVLESYDLSKGSLSTRTVIRTGAVPIDNITKFAWADDDYEEVQVYIPYGEPENTPSQLDRIEAQLAYTAMMTGTLVEEV